MRFHRSVAIVAAVAAFTCTTPVLAAVITGPSLTISDQGYDQSGIAFQALTNSLLTSVVFQSQSNADTITLSDLLGNVLYSQTVAAGSASNTVSLGWSLVAGNSYRLLQNAANNAKYAVYGSTPPSDSDIALTSTGVFHQTGAGANSFAFDDNQYWAAFNNITTASAVAAVPEASTWAMMVIGLGCGGWAMRRRQKIAQRVVFAV